jgi:hypothetical protein
MDEGLLKQHLRIVKGYAKKFELSPNGDFAHAKRMFSLTDDQCNQLFNNFSKARANRCAFGFAWREDMQEGANPDAAGTGADE